ncbi:hypothetical protein ACTXNE_05290 [Psychrobacter namhaensis]|jgi:hypothetical protein|uniref:hypothetical protein n=1 Tax=Psychrobacter namhaensis TaxID=292734 RepID=UPI000ECCC70A|nr:hypothetical protein [Psychrobacter sp.]|tara:strand:- start:5704 stop:5895 length:192 start_codon:yes stop_codon:yes gene_type:complete
MLVQIEHWFEQIKLDDESERLLAVGADFFTTWAVCDDHQNSGWFNSGGFCVRNGLRFSRTILV